MLVERVRRPHSYTVLLLWDRRYYSSIAELLLAPEAQDLCTLQGVCDAA